MKALVKSQRKPGLWLEDVPEPAISLPEVAFDAGVFAARWLAQAPSSNSTAAAVIARLSMARFLLAMLVATRSNEPRTV